MGTINTRLTWLEQQQGTDDQRRRQIEADAAEFRRRLQALTVTMNQDGRAVDPDAVDPGARARFDDFMAKFRAETAYPS